MSSWASRISTAAVMKRASAVSSSTFDCEAATSASLKRDEKRSALKPVLVAWIGSGGGVRRSGPALTFGNVVSVSAARHWRRCDSTAGERLEANDRLPDLDDRAVVQFGGAGYFRTVDLRAVEAEISDHPAAVLEVDLRVQARREVVLDDDGTIAASAEGRGLSRCQFESDWRSLARIDTEPRSHGFLANR